MTQEDKQLLLQDLCARLPYKCNYKASKKITHWNKLTLSTGTIDKIIDDYYDEIKPYLRPMSSMTEEEKKEFYKVVYDSMNIDNISPSVYVGEWQYSKHFDVHGLIEKGLALEAPEGMYKKEE
jgi:hypothetical protein